MTSKSKAQRFGPGPDSRPTTVVKDPSEVIAIIPYLLGFDPADSIVVVALEGPRNRFGPCFRLDLAASDDAAQQAAAVVGFVTQLGCATVIVVVFGDDPGRADPVVRDVSTQLAARGITVQEALRADGQRWWSYTCCDPDCCSPDGTPYDISTSRVAAEAVVAGLQRLPSRDSLRLQLEPLPVRRSAVNRLRSEREVVAPTEAELVRILDKGVGDARSLSDMDLLSVATGVQQLALRDLAWMQMSRDNADSHFAVWSQVMRCVPDDLLAPVGSLTAFAAWLNGSGVLASHAVDRVLAVYPRYSMALLIGRILQSGINPSRWDELALDGLRSSSGGGSLTG